MLETISHHTMLETINEGIITNNDEFDKYIIINKNEFRKFIIEFKKLCESVKETVREINLTERRLKNLINESKSMQ